MTHEKPKENTPDDGLLEAHFQAARRSRPTPEGDLVQRIVADAAEVQHAFLAPRTQPAAGAPLGLKGVFSALGGWPAAASLSGAALVGLWIGIAPPDALMLMAQDLMTVPGDTSRDGATDGGLDFLEEML